MAMPDAIVPRADIDSAVAAGAGVAAVKPFDAKARTLPPIKAIPDRKLGRRRLRLQRCCFGGSIRARRREQNEQDQERDHTKRRHGWGLRKSLAFCPYKAEAPREALHEGFIPKK
jgi:hypothetical protein